MVIWSTRYNTSTSSSSLNMSCCILCYLILSIVLMNNISWKFYVSSSFCKKSSVFTCNYCCSCFFTTLIWIHYIWTFSCSIGSHSIYQGFSSSCCCISSFFNTSSRCIYSCSLYKNISIIWSICSYIFISIYSFRKTVICLFISYNTVICSCYSTSNCNSRTFLLVCIIIYYREYIICWIIPWFSMYTLSVSYYRFISWCSCMICSCCTNCYSSTISSKIRSSLSWSHINIWIYFYFTRFIKECVSIVYK